MSEEWEQLRTLRGLTATTGVLHEAQVLQLKHWPRLAMPHAKSSECAYDFESKLVEFRVALSSRKPPTNLRKRLNGLDRSVKDMLGPEFTVRVAANGKIIFKSAGKKPKDV